MFLTNAGTVLGTDPLDRNFTGVRSYLRIGSGNKIREHFTISRGTPAESATEIGDYFRRNMGIGDVVTACEYLADEGLLGKAQTPVRLTRHSNIQVQELAFYYISLEPPPDDW